ncbi:MAG: hypothetical protein HQL52_17470 [Magnetococcales bacterium]|nr:hypothetical protein [Magnetococcales bacterium]
MSRSLGDLLLPDGTQWKDRHERSDLTQPVTRTLGGRLVVSAPATTGGRSITLTMVDEVSWPDQDFVDAVTEMASVPGASYTLEWDDESYVVMFRHHEPPAVSFIPLWPNHNQYTGVIRLFTVT